jgi:hypothetical protein
MAKLFLFGIGGTGARVIKSLTMLLGCGVQPNRSEIDEIVPIIIDPHGANEDLKRTISLLNNYQRIYERLGDNRQGFFSTKITTLNQGAFTYKIQEVNNDKFRDYIDYSNLDANNQDLATLLFSKETLDVEMDIGFVGNPNIGSVVLNQFRESPEFQQVASNFSNGDRIFIISSIFGGTGAAGFPLLVKNIRNANATGNDLSLTNKDLLSNAPIGAVSVLPYFGVTPNAEKAISKSDFFVKTKAALAYYEKNLSGRSGALNAHYYIGDLRTADYENDPGGGGQKNNAHFVEVASALSIIEFMELSTLDLKTANGRALNTLHYEFGIKSDDAMLTFNNLGNATQLMLAKKMTKYFLFKKYLEEEFNDKIKGNAPFTNAAPKLDNSFTSTPFYRNYLTDFNAAFQDWLDELETNDRKFKPFNQNALLSKSINGIDAKGGFFAGKFDEKAYTSSLNKISSKRKDYTSAEHKLIELFDAALEVLLKDKYDYFNNF